MGDKKPLQPSTVRRVTDVHPSVVSAAKTKPKRVGGLLKNKNALLAAGLVILVIALVVLGIKYQAQQRKLESLSSPGKTSEQQKELVANVGKIVELPKNEEPLVVSVADVSKLKEQPFFADAQNGDKVLVFSESKLAILYRPSTNKVVQASKVNLGDINQKN